MGRIFKGTKGSNSPFAGAAAMLSAFGFVVGPFVYFGHEKAWDTYGSRRAGEKTRPVRAEIR
jgi:hypothetical protein